MDTAFLKDSGDLEALLRIAEVEDLDILVDYITDKGAGRISLPTSTRKHFEACKQAGLYPDVDRAAIAQEILLFGGNSIVNLFRGGKGVSYTELVGDVASRLKVVYPKGATAFAIEEAIVSRLYDDTLTQMPSIERGHFLMAKASAVNGAGAKDATEAFFRAEVVANGMSTKLLGRGISPWLGIAAAQLVPFVGWLAGIWGLAELASAAYRVTVPSVIQIAYIRQKALNGRLPGKCTHCATINAAEAKFCSECGQALPQKPVPSTALTTPSF